MSRYAAIDVGTNSVLLLVAQRQSGPPRFVPALERSEITRLGRGVDKTGELDPEAIEATIRVLERFAHEARELGAQAIVTTATSAARDARNGGAFITAVKERTGLEIEIISGDEEARLSFRSAFEDFGGTQPLVVLDIGGGSTEFIFGNPSGAILFRRSFDLGSVRLTERSIRTDPPSSSEQAAITNTLRDAFAALPAAPLGFRMVGLAGTVTTLCAVARNVEPYDSARIHGVQLTLAEVDTALARLASLPTMLRKTVPGLQPKRADVIVAGGAILQAAMRAVGATDVTVSDRGLRWGLLSERFGAPA